MKDRFARTLNYDTAYIKKKISNEAILFNPIPNESNRNNLKSSKYFASQKGNSTREALNIYLKEKTMQNNTTIKPKKCPEFNMRNCIRNNSTFIQNKQLVLYAEPKAMIKKSYRIKEKFFEENVYDSNESEDEMDEACAVYSNTKSFGQFQMTNFSTLINQNESFSSNENDIDNDKDEKHNEEKQNVQLESKDFDYQQLISLSKLYSDFIKDLEVNKMEMFYMKIEIVNDFINYYNNKEYYNNLLIFFEEKCDKSKKSFQRVSKEFFIQQLIFLYTFIFLSYIKENKDNYLQGLKNLLFYFNQNFVAVLLLIISIQDQKNKDNKKNNEAYNKCIKITNENKTWINNQNSKDCIVANNKITKIILTNIIIQMKNYFNENQLQIKNDQNEQSLIDIDINTLFSIFQNTLNSLNNLSLGNIISNLSSNKTIITVRNSINLNAKQEQINNSLFNVENDDQNQQIPSIPFLPSKTSLHDYTLVLDLDETLVHYIEDEESAYIQIRKGAEDFLSDLSQYFEIVIFTAGTQNYADIVIDGIDKNKAVSYRLYRQHTTSLGNANVKDLSKIGRDIKKVIIIDNAEDNYSLQPRNGLNIVEFTGNENDIELNFLKEDLIDLHKRKPEDVRNLLPEIQKKMNERAALIKDTKGEVNENIQ